MSVVVMLLRERMRAQGRLAAALLAVPFLVCFSSFGLINVVGGAVLTLMASEPLLVQLPQEGGIGRHFNTMQVIGIILLVTGCLLIVIGISLAIIACRSVEESGHRKKNFVTSISAAQFPYGSIDSSRSSRRTSSASFCSVSGRSRNGGRRSPEKTFSPIPEANSEEERGEGVKVEVQVHIADRGDYVGETLGADLFHARDFVEMSGVSSCRTESFSSTDSKECFSAATSYELRELGHDGDCDTSHRDTPDAFKTRFPDTQQRHFPQIHYENAP